MKKKILYLADRNMLVDQSIAQDFAPLEKTIHKVNAAKDDKTKITSHEVYFSLYQQLIGDDDKEHFRELFDPDFFDLVIVDECHRGSAKDDSNWIPQSIRRVRGSSARRTRKTPAAPSAVQSAGSSRMTAANR